MSWIKRYADTHKCSFPVQVNKNGFNYTTNRNNLPDATNGDIWECNSTNCSKQYLVKIIFAGDYILFESIN